MSARQSERTKKMKLSFMEMHNDGKTIEEIANHFNISRRTIYNYLQEIADNHGVSRESLLEKVNKTHQKKSSITHLEKVDIDELRKSFADISANTKTIIETIDKVLCEEED